MAADGVAAQHVHGHGGAVIERSARSAAQRRVADGVLTGLEYGRAASAGTAPALSREEKGQRRNGGRRRKRERGEAVSEEASLGRPCPAMPRAAPLARCTRGLHWPSRAAPPQGWGSSYKSMDPAAAPRGRGAESGTGGGGAAPAGYATALTVTWLRCAPPSWWGAAAQRRSPVRARAARAPRLPRVHSYSMMHVHTAHPSRSRPEPPSSPGRQADADALCALTEHRKSMGECLDLRC